MIVCGNIALFFCGIKIKYLIVSVNLEICISSRKGSLRSAKEFLLLALFFKNISDSRKSVDKGSVLALRVVGLIAKYR